MPDDSPQSAGLASGGGKSGNLAAKDAVNNSVQGQQDEDLDLDDEHEVGLNPNVIYWEKFTVLRIKVGYKLDNISL